MHESPMAPVRDPAPRTELQGTRREFLGTTLSGLAAAGVGSLAALPSAVAAPRNDPDPYEPYGVHEHLTWRWFFRDDESLNRALDMMRDAGIQWIRTAATWQDVEPERGAIAEEQVRRIDTVIELAARRGLKISLLINGTPRWASSEPMHQDFNLFHARDPADWERYVGFLANRYRGKITHWEIKNEVDLPIFWKAGIPKYVECLKQASRVIKGVDESNRIILAGLASDGVHAFSKRAQPNALQQIYDAGGGPFFDIAAIHCYFRPDGPRGIEQPVKKLQTAHEVMAANRDGNKPLWMNELGENWLGKDGKPPVPPAVQAEDLIQVYNAILQLPFVDKVFWYNFRCKGDDPTDQTKQRGLVSFDMTPRPVYEAYRQMKKFRQHPTRG